MAVHRVQPAKITAETIALAPSQPPKEAMGDAGAASLEKSTLMELPSVAVGKRGDLHHNLDDLLKGVIGTNLRISQEMLLVTHHREFVALQQRFIQDYLVALTQGSIQLIDTISELLASKTPP